MSAPTSSEPSSAPPPQPPTPSNPPVPASSAPTSTSTPNSNRANNPVSTIRFGVTATVRATQHQLPSTRAGGGTPGFVVGGAGANIPAPAATTNNNAGEGPQQTQNLFQMRDRLFLALFFRVSLIYARAFPKSLRRFIEFCLLMQSVTLLFILGYIHVVYTKTPITCLSEYKDSWPKNGILRVEITTDPLSDYDLTKSYAKEERLRQRAAASQFGQYTDDLLSIMLTADTLLLDRVVSTAGGLLATVTGADNTPVNGEQTLATTTGDQATVSPTSSVETDPPPDPSISASASASSSDESDQETVEDSADDVKNEDVEASQQSNKSVELLDEESVAAAEGEERGSSSDAMDAISPSAPITASGEGSVTPSPAQITEGIEQFDVTDPDSPYFNKTLEEIEVMKMQQKQLEEDKLLNSSVTDFEMFANSVWLQEQAYIVEYALEYGFLRLSPETRQKLGIPVKLVILDPNKEACFGDHFSLFLLENFLGYDDILMSSIKNLAESEENKGYLRNVVTGEQFRFVPMWMARSSYIPALLIMLVFTVSISMLLRYSHHQIFVFIVDLLNNIEGAGSIHIPAAPLFTVILALVGMEAIMSEFFNDTTTAFYVILIVWIADQYDSVCSHTNITKIYWVRFFYLYHFAFYAYHYRFNGQYGGLALLVSWSFIQHSMVYFYHHYELPAILRQAHNPGHLQENMRPPTSPQQQPQNATSAESPSSPQLPQNVDDSAPPSNANISSSPESADNLSRTVTTEQLHNNSLASSNAAVISTEANVHSPSEVLQQQETSRLTVASGQENGSGDSGEVSSSLLTSSAPTSFNRRDVNITDIRGGSGENNDCNDDVEILHDSSENVAISDKNTVTSTSLNTAQSPSTSCSRDGTRLNPGDDAKELSPSDSSPSSSSSSTNTAGSDNDGLRHRLP